MPFWERERPGGRSATSSTSAALPRCAARWNPAGIAADGAGNTTSVTRAVTRESGPPSAFSQKLPIDPAFNAPPLNPNFLTTTFSANEFLYTGPSPIQTGVAAGTIVLERAAAIRGRVLDRDGSPVQGVTVTVNEEGTILVNDTPATLEGLFEALEAALAESREKLVILRGDKSVQLGQAVNILDLAQQAGATGIALATKPPAAEKS